LEGICSARNPQKAQESTAQLVTGPKLNSGEGFDEGVNECSELKSIAEHRAHKEAVVVEVIGLFSMFVIDDGLATSREWNDTNTSTRECLTSSAEPSRC
jgi:hypothetical protein